MGANEVVTNEPGSLVARRLITAEEYDRLGETGILSDGDRVELIEGELVAVKPIGIGHAWIVSTLDRLLSKIIEDRAVVFVQSPLRLGNLSEPEPDLVLLNPPAETYRKKRPAAEDVLLLIEVSDSTLRYGRTVKLPLYARWGVPEVWIVDVNVGVVEICRAPVGDRFTSIDRIGRGGKVEPQAFPGAMIEVSSLLD